MDTNILDKIILPAELKEIIEGGVNFVVPIALYNTTNTF